jgi:hypothetical protein
MVSIFICLPKSYGFLHGKSKLDDKLIICIGINKFVFDLWVQD